MIPWVKFTMRVIIVIIRGQGPARNGECTGVNLWDGAETFRALHAFGPLPRSTNVRGILFNSTSVPQTNPTQETDMVAHASAFTPGFASLIATNNRRLRLFFGVIVAASGAPGN